MMHLTNLGNSVFRLTNEMGSVTEKKKTPPNRSTVLFMRRGDDIMIIRGSFMASKAEIMRAAASAV